MLAADSFTTNLKSYVEDKGLILRLGVAAAAAATGMGLATFVTGPLSIITTINFVCSMAATVTVRP